MIQKNSVKTECNIVSVYDAIKNTKKNIRGVIPWALSY